MYVVMSVCVCGDGRMRGDGLMRCEMCVYVVMSVCVCGDECVCM